MSPNRVVGQIVGLSEIASILSIWNLKSNNASRVDQLFAASPLVEALEILLSASIESAGIGCAKVGR